MNNRSVLLNLIAEKHQHIFEEVLVNGVKTYPGNTHENCARLLYDFCVAANQQFPLEKFGLLTKDSGENGYTWPNGIRTSHDVIAIPNGERTDVIGAAGSIDDKPSITWQPRTPDTWRPNNVWIEHIKVLAGQMPELPTNPSSKIPYDEQKSIEFGLACNDIYIESNKPFDAGMVSVHSSRAAWDYYVGGLTWKDSKKKHINEFRAVYGLLPV